MVHSTRQHNEPKMVCLQTKSKRIRSRVQLYFTPFRLKSGTARMPCLNSDTGKQVWPPKSSFSLESYSCTSRRSRASSGTVSLNVNSWFQTGVHVSYFTSVFSIVSSAGAPAIPTCILLKNFKFQFKIKDKKE